MANRTANRMHAGCENRGVKVMPRFGAKQLKDGIVFIRDGETCEWSMSRREGRGLVLDLFYLGCLLAILVTLLSRQLNIYGSKVPKQKKKEISAKGSTWKTVYRQH